MKILNIGSINIDYVYEVDDFVKSGETIPSNNFKVFLGGKGLNQSVALAQAGSQVFHAGNINIKDDNIKKELTKWNVNIDYIKEDGSIGRYHPDFYLTLNNGERWVIETKGAEEVNAQRKIQRLKVWCEDATLSQGVKWDCLYVRQENWNKLKNFPNSFDEIIKIFEVSKIKETQ